MNGLTVILLGSSSLCSGDLGEQAVEHELRVAGLLGAIDIEMVDVDLTSKRPEKDCLRKITLCLQRLDPKSNVAVFTLFDFISLMKEKRNFNTIASISDIIRESKARIVLSQAFSGLQVCFSYLLPMQSQSVIISAQDWLDVLVVDRDSVVVGDSKITGTDVVASVSFAWKFDKNTFETIGQFLDSMESHLDVSIAHGCCRVFEALHDSRGLYEEVLPFVFNSYARALVEMPSAANTKIIEILLDSAEQRERFQNYDRKKFDRFGSRIYDALCAKDRSEICGALSLRVLVTGHDLKFIDFVYNYLPQEVTVREDKWVGENRHDEAVSLELLAWADVIWVEWLAGAAAWYSSRVSRDQKLFIRCHRYEVSRNYGHRINYDRVDAIVVIAFHVGEAIVERFAIPREKIRYIYNIYEPERYRLVDGTEENRSFNIALVGSVPRLKGLHRALEILAKLRESDDRYNLTIFGKKPEDLSWINNSPHEMAYYRACDTFMNSPQLQGAVQYAGWADLREELHKYGFVLSTSDLEGSHVSPGEAFMVGNIGVLVAWKGVEYVYPNDFVFSNADEAARYILTNPLENPEIMKSVKRLREFLTKYQSADAFVKSVHHLLVGRTGIDNPTSADVESE